MKVINSKLAAIGLAAFVFASCSDSTDGPSTNPETIDATTLGLTSTTPSTVFNYKNGTANARKFFMSRAASNTEFVTAMPEMPTQPNLISELNAGTDLVYDANKATNTYVIKNKNKLDFTGKKIKGVTIFIKGDCKITYDESLGGNTFVLDKGATLEFTGKGPMLAKGDKLYNKLSGTIKSSNDIVIEGEIYADWVGTGESGQEMKGGLGTTTADAKGNKVLPTQNITFKNGAKAYINGSLRAKKLTIEDGAVVTTTCNVLNSEQVDLYGALKVDGFFHTGVLNINGLLDASAATAAVKASKELNLEDGSIIKANYVNVTNNEYDANKKVTKVGEAALNLKKGGKILISDKSVINVNNLNTDNASSGQVTLQGNNAVAVIKADKFTNNGDEMINSFATPGTNSTLLLQLSQCYNGTSEMPSQADLDISASYLDYDKATTGDVVDFKDEENKQYGYELKVDVNAIKETPKLDLVSAFGSANTLSATCIQTVGNYVYVSYHTHGNHQYGGGLEVLRMDNNQLTAEQQVTANAGLDVNHLIVDNNKLYVAASDQQKGAFFGVADLENNIIKGGTENLEMKEYAFDATNKKNGIDANCVVKYGDNFVVSSTRGYELYDKNFTHTTFTTPADAKHVTVGDGKLYGLVANGTTNGIVNVFNGVNLAQDKATLTFNTFGNVSPVDGKNTIAYDNGYLYVCQGENGLICYNATTGKEEWAYTVPTIQNQKSEKYGNVKGYCNGVAVDSKYVYVAAGGYGVVVLDKNNKGKELCHRVAFNGKTEDGKLVNANSANYVTIGQDGNIYVAYGKSRVQVFKLTSTKK